MKCPVCASSTVIAHTLQSLLLGGFKPISHYLCLRCGVLFIKTAHNEGISVGDVVVDTKKDVAEVKEKLFNIEKSLIIRRFKKSISNFDKGNITKDDFVEMCNKFVDEIKKVIHG